MTIDFTQAFKTLDGKDFPAGATEDGPLRLRAVATNALLSAFQDEQQLSGEDKIKRWKLAQRIHAEDAVNLTAEEIALTKKLIAKGYATLISAQAWEMLEAERGTST